MLSKAEESGCFIIQKNPGAMKCAGVFLCLADDLYVEQEVHYVAILNHVLLALDGDLARFAARFLRA